jgi:hypothetical protein
LTEEDLEEITKEWSVDLLIPADPMEISDIDSPKAVHDTPGPSKTKKNEDTQDVSSTSAKTASISAEQGGDGREIDGTEVNRRKVRLHHLEMRRTPQRKGRFPHRNPHPERK